MERRGVVVLEVWKIIAMTLTCYADVSGSSLPCELLYGGCKHNVDHFFPPVVTLKHHPEPPRYSQQVYVPSPPGKAPRCAKPGFTFCEKIEKYPGDLIKTLAAKVSFNYQSLFTDESGGSKRETQANNNQNVKFNQASQFPPPTSQVYQSIGTNIVTTNFNQSSQPEVYPDRQYRLDESVTHLVDPVLYASFGELNPYNPTEWWKRSERGGGSSDGSKTGNKRKRRQSSSPAGTELCPTRSQFIMPRAALNNRGEWRYVVNVEQGSEKYTQLVKSETCLTTECNGLCSLPNGYTSRCEQKYVQKRLVALEGTGSNLYTDIFWFPHCCVCQTAPDIR